MFHHAFLTRTSHTIELYKKDAVYCSFPYVKFLQMQNIVIQVPEMSDAGPIWRRWNFAKEIAVYCCYLLKPAGNTIQNNYAHLFGVMFFLLHIG